VSGHADQIFSVAAITRAALQDIEQASYFALMAKPAQPPKMPLRIKPWLLSTVLTLALCAPAHAQAPAPEALPSTSVAPAQSATARNGMVASQDAHATRIGVAILERGGNAVDAAVAVGFALAASMPRAGNLGGGGFMVIHLADGRATTIDYRESAPAATRPDVFLNDKGEADAQKSRFSGLAIGVPGTVAGLALAHARYGSRKFKLADLIAPAIKLAREGVPVDHDLLDSLLIVAPRLAKDPSAAKIFLQANGAAPSQGTLLKQPELAASLERIARDGTRGFYQGPVAQSIVATVRAAGGQMTADDLKAYRAIERPPVRGTYRGHAIVSMPPPSSGGVHLIEMLNILEGFPLGSGTLAFGSPDAAHLMIEAMKLAYADRAEFLGDSDAVNVPVARLISKDHARGLRAEINPQRARGARELRPNSPAIGAGSGGNTTHFSVVDRFGNAVANTYSLNFNYGVGLVADGTGILLNNTLDDFAAKPGAPNAFGLVGASANAPGPNKRPLSSMTPTIVLKNGKPAILTGAPGGSRIITAVLQVIINVIDFRMPLADAVAAPRVHHQWLPDRVLVERTLPAATVQALEARGHTVNVGPPSGSAHSIAATAAGLVGAADGRSRGALAEGY
jgi:gamma-glutamyltranspeptidase / glutathione hydrolase